VIYCTPSNLGEYVKHVVILLVLGSLIVISGCSVKKKGEEPISGSSEANKDSGDQNNDSSESSDVGISEAPKILDRDFDLISDASDQNPDVANVPEINLIGLRSSKISYKVATNNLGREHEISLLKDHIESSGRLARQIVVGEMRDDLLQEDVDFAPFQDEEFWGVSFYKGWGNPEYVLSKANLLSHREFDLVPYSGHFKLRYKLYLKDLYKVDFVENIKVRVGARDSSDSTIDLFSHLLRDDHLKSLRINTQDVGSLETLDVYDSLSNENDPEVIRSQIEGRTQMTVGVENFTFSRTGKKIDYLDFVQNLKSKLSTIIISQDKDIKRYFVTPGKTLEIILKQLNFKLELDDRGKLTHFNGETTSVLMPDNLGDPLSDFLTGNILKVFGTDDLRENVVSGQTYIVSLATGEEVFNSKKETVELAKDFEFQNSISLQNLRKGDEIEFEISAHRERMRTKTVGQSVEAVVDVETCEHGGRGEPRECKTDYVYGWCGINTIVKSGHTFLKKTIFHKDIPHYRLRASNGKVLPLKAVSNFVSFNSREKVIGVFKVKKWMLSSGRTLQIIEDSPKGHSVKLGFSGYSNCGHRGRGSNFRFARGNHGNSWNETTQDIVKSKITLKRRGALR
jgi:hypothetical protein